MAHCRNHESRHSRQATRPLLWEAKTGKKLIITHVKAGKSVAATLE